jgi:hypothetical protein
MSVIQSLVSGRNDTVDYELIKLNYPWITKKNQKCILSPDSDGLLCGLFMSYYMNWEVVGFYDGKVAVIKEGVNPSDEDVVFLDIEIYRKNIRSMGHHMLSLNNRWLPLDWNDNFRNCIQPNLFRGFDGKNTFRLKYPLATIHFLIGILENELQIEVNDRAIFPLIFTDGTYNVMFSYPENVMLWWHYLKIEKNSKLLNKVFLNEDYSVVKLMKEMQNFFWRRDEISAPKERGDRMKISNKDSSPYNIEIDKNGKYKINDDAKNRCISFLKLLEEDTKWEFDISKWNFDNFKLFSFKKRDFKSMGWTLKKSDWEKFLALNPLSWAMTSGDNIEFTIEENDFMI